MGFLTVLSLLPFQHHPHSSTPPLAPTYRQFLFSFDIVLFLKQCPFQKKKTFLRWRQVRIEKNRLICWLRGNISSLFLLQFFVEPKQSSTPKITRKLRHLLRAQAVVTKYAPWGFIFPKSIKAWTKQLQRFAICIANAMSLQYNENLQRKLFSS